MKENTDYFYIQLLVNLDKGQGREEPGMGNPNRG